jgi:hypothetical protein
MNASEASINANEARELGKVNGERLAKAQVNAAIAELIVEIHHGVNDGIREAQIDIFEGSALSRLGYLNEIMKYFEKENYKVRVDESEPNGYTITVSW